MTANYVGIYDDTNRYNWSQALEYCQRVHNSYLATITTSVDGYIDTVFAEQLNFNHEPNISLWVGWNDIKSEGNFEFVDGTSNNSCFDICEESLIYYLNSNTNELDCFACSNLFFTEYWETYWTYLSCSNTLNAFICNQPTAFPTTFPTSPTSIPSNQPTVLPTLRPSDIPTIVPTNMPTEIPSANPTGIPTVEPSVQPTSLPSVLPTEIPTTGPTISVSEGKQESGGDGNNRNNNRNNNGSMFGSDPTVDYIIIALIISGVIGLILWSWFYMAEVRPRLKNGILWESQRINNIRQGKGLNGGLNVGVDNNGNNNNVELKELSSRSGTGVNGINDEIVITGDANAMNGMNRGNGVRVTEATGMSDNLGGSENVVNINGNNKKKDDIKLEMDLTGQNEVLINANKQVGGPIGGVRNNQPGVENDDEVYRYVQNINANDFQAIRKSVVGNTETNVEGENGKEFQD